MEEWHTEEDVLKGIFAKEGYVEVDVGRLADVMRELREGRLKLSDSSKHSQIRSFLTSSEARSTSPPSRLKESEEMIELETSSP